LEVDDKLSWHIAIERKYVQTGDNMAFLKGSNIVLVIMLLVGGLTGSAMADILSGYAPFLQSTIKIGFDPFIMDLHFITMTFGFKMAFSILTALGMVAGYWLYKKI
jgi:hypothetical protein